MSLQNLFCRALLASQVRAKIPRANGAADQDLTPLGSNESNKDGSIPAWTGGLTSPPEGIGYEKGKHLPDPSPPISPYCVLQGLTQGIVTNI